MIQASLALPPMDMGLQVQGYIYIYIYIGVRVIPATPG